jgi:hypothetical protein
MAIYPPPIENVPIFDTSQFAVLDSAGNLLQSFVEYPTAQGDITLQNTIVNGTLTVSSTLTSDADIVVTGDLQANTINENNTGTLTVGNDTGAILFGGVSTTSNITINAVSTSMNCPVIMGTGKTLTANGINLGSNSFINVGTPTIAPTLSTQYGFITTGVYGTTIPVSTIPANFTANVPIVYASLQLSAGCYLLQGQGQINYGVTGGAVRQFSTTIRNKTTNAIEGRNQVLMSVASVIGPYQNQTNGIIGITTDTVFDLELLADFDAPSTFIPINSNFQFYAMRIA